MSSLAHRRACGRSYWPVVLFMLGFAALLLAVLYYFLAPAMTAAKTATPLEKKTLVAYSRLLLAVVLFVLFVMLIIAFRVRKFFQPRAAAPRMKTKYVDAWQESARRMETPPQE